MCFEWGGRQVRETETSRVGDGEWGDCRGTACHAGLQGFEPLATLRLQGICIDMECIWFRSTPGAQAWAGVLVRRQERCVWTGRSMQGGHDVPIASCQQCTMIPWQTRLWYYIQRGTCSCAWGSARVFAVGPFSANHQFVGCKITSDYGSCFIACVWLW